MSAGGVSAGSTKLTDHAVQTDWLVRLRDLGMQTPSLRRERQYKRLWGISSDGRAVNNLTDLESRDSLIDILSCDVLVNNPLMDEHLPVSPASWAGSICSDAPFDENDSVRRCRDERRECLGRRSNGYGKVRFL